MTETGGIAYKEEKEEGRGGGGEEEEEEEEGLTVKFYNGISYLPQR